MFNRRRFARLLVAGSIAAASTLPFATKASAADTATDESRIVELINIERTNAGLAPLKVHVQLVTTSRQWSAVMTADWEGTKEFNCAVKHDPVLQKAGDGLPWRRLGENVGCGGRDADKGFADMIHIEFMNSHEHKKNIMNPSFDSVGIGIVESGEIRFVTERFMDLDDRATSPSSSVPDALALTAPQVKTAQVAAPPARVPVKAAKPAKTPKTKATKAPKAPKAKAKKAVPAKKTGVAV